MSFQRPLPPVKLLPGAQGAMGTMARPRQGTARRASRAQRWLPGPGGRCVPRLLPEPLLHRPRFAGGFVSLPGREWAIH